MTDGDGLQDGGPRHRVLLVVPFPPRRDQVHGGRIVAQLLLRLAEHHEIGVVYLRGPGDPGLEADVAAACSLVREVASRRATSPWRHRWNVIGGAVAGLPTQTRTVDATFASAVAETCREWRPEVVQLEHNEIAHIASAIDSDAVTVLVCHEPGLLAARDQMERTTGRQRLAHRTEMRSWRRYWRRWLPRIDAIVCFAQEDCRLIAPYTGDTELEVIPLGAEVGDALDPAGHDDGPVCLVGNYRHPPNADAALRLMREIMPRVREQVPGRRLEVVGAKPTPAMTRAAGPEDTVTGFVESVAPHVDAAALLALPIRMGGGMRVKLLEALAAGKAVVASPLAAAGVTAHDGEELVLAETDEEFAAAITALLRDADARRRIGTAARAWAVRELSWDPRVRQYGALYDRLLGR